MRTNKKKMPIQIDDLELDVQTVMARIREGMREGALDDDVEFPTFALAHARRRANLGPNPPEGQVLSQSKGQVLSQSKGQVLSQSKGSDWPLFSKELYYHLEQANLNYDQVLVELSVIESQMPLLGFFVNRFKRELHQLVVYYVNMVAERQVVVNDAVVQALNQMVERLDIDPPKEFDFGSLQQQIAELRERLEGLEAHVRGTEAGE